MKKVRLLVLTIVTLILVQSCSKEGPAGPAGAQGPQGPQGPQGGQGNTGTANVTYSPWFNPVTWTNSGTANVYYNKTAAGITQAIVDQGVVLAYVKFTEDAGLVRSLPAVTFSGQVIWTYLISPGLIRFNVNPTSGTGGFSPSFTMQFRYVIIPGGVAGGRMSSKPYTLQQLQSMTYEQVMELYHIPENDSNSK